MQDFFKQPPCIIIEHGKAKSEMLARAMYKGWGGYGGLIVNEPDEVPDGYAPVFIGMRPALAKLLHGLREQNREYLTVDNGYFQPYKQGHFRVTQNALQFGDAIGSAFPEEIARWRALNEPIQPWRGTGVHNLIVLQSEPWYEMVLGVKRADWLAGVVRQIEQISSRPILIRDKPLKGRGPTTTIFEDMEDAWVVISLSSNCLVQAAQQGIPVLPVGHCAASPLGTSFSRLKTPYYPEDREAVFAQLAANQWTLQEIADGVMYRTLAARPRPPYRPLA